MCSVYLLSYLISTKVQILTAEEVVLQVKEEWGLFERTSQDSYAYNLAPHIPRNEQQQGGSPAVMHGGLEEEDKLRQLQVVGTVLAKCVVDQQLSSVRIVAPLYENPRIRTLVA